MVRTFLFSLLGAFISLNSLTALMSNDVMSQAGQQRTGLIQTETKVLEEGVADTVIVLKEQDNKPTPGDLYVTEVINSGQQLRLSDNSLYEVAPDDWARASSWIIAARIRVTKSDNPYYPWQIMNPLSGLSVKARLLERPAAPEPL